MTERVAASFRLEARIGSLNTTETGFIRQTGTALPSGTMLATRGAVLSVVEPVEKVERKSIDKAMFDALLTPDVILIR